MQVALKRFTDDVAIEVVEAKLVSPLHEIFSPISVVSMATDLVTSVAGESEDHRAQREQLLKQLDVLSKSFETCKRFNDIRVLGKRHTQTSSTGLLLTCPADVDDSTTQGVSSFQTSTSDRTDSHEKCSDLAPEHAESPTKDLSSDIELSINNPRDWRDEVELKAPEPEFSELEIPEPESKDEDMYYSKKKSKKVKRASQPALFEF